MSKDYKSQSVKSASGKSWGLFLWGLVIGMALGLGVAGAVAWHINQLPNPFLAKDKAAKPAQTKPEAMKPAPLEADKPEKTAEAKPRFDFYKILPGAEEPVTEQELKSKAQPAKDAWYFLQAGSFQNASDADNLKAKLALLGAEAAIQTVILPDKGVWHRVRVGPYKTVEELDRMRQSLKQNGIETNLIKVREAKPNKSD